MNKFNVGDTVAFTDNLRGMTGTIVASNIQGLLGDYIVRNDSGGKIMDVWVLHDVIVQSEFNGAGWLFKDQTGNVVHLGGDVKVIRLNRGNMADWHEYHAEFETHTYQELYVKK